MGYIKAILPMKAYRLLMEMESGSMVIVDLFIDASCKAKNKSTVQRDGTFIVCDK